MLIAVGVLSPSLRRRFYSYMPKTVLGWIEAAICVIAGVWTLIHIIVDASGFTGDDGWGWALLALFVISVILAFVRFSQERTSFSKSDDKFPEPTISRFFQGSTGTSPMWFVVRMNVGAAWLLAGWEKVTDPAWGTSGVGLTGFAKGAIAGASGAHPSVQGWYAWFLQHVVLNAAGLFSFAVTWGELLVGLGILFGVLTGIAAGFGVLMNLNYVLAGTVSINPVIGTMGLFLILSWRVCGWIGGDRWLLPAIGLPWKPGALFQQQQQQHRPAGT